MQASVQQQKFNYDGLVEKAQAVCNFMYGTKERTWITLAVCFGMLVGGIGLMQAAANGGLCGGAM